MERVGVERERERVCVDLGGNGSSREVVVESVWREVCIPTKL